jgi:hypothetical protein
MDMTGKRRGSPYLDIAIKDLQGWDYDVTSEPTDAYNCIAFAVGDESSWWDPFDDEGGYWPEGAPRQYTLDAYLCAFELSGFKRCDDDALEEGYEKIAVYTDEAGRVHAARQIDALYWRSKLGRLHDIQHPLKALVEEYGEVRVFMRRPRGG